jgi:hypothetical protein
MAGLGGTLTTPYTPACGTTSPATATDTSRTCEWQRRERVGPAAAQQLVSHKLLGSAAVWCPACTVLCMICHATPRDATSLDAMPACSDLWDRWEQESAGDALPGREANGRGAGAGGGTGGGVGPLLPEFAQLQRLTTLVYGPDGHSIDAGIPVEWGQPGAFPRLTR